MIISQVLCQDIMEPFGIDRSAAAHLKQYGFGWLTQRELTEFVAEHGCRLAAAQA